MANTYSEVYLQAVFAVKYRQALLDVAWDSRLRSYITAIVQNHGHKMISINNVADHIHMLFGFSTEQSISDLLRDVKGCSSKWIADKGFCDSRFNWQSGYGVFSYSKAELPRVIRYIENQQIHHKTVSFETEYIELLNERQAEYDPRYIFKPLQ